MFRVRLRSLATLGVAVFLVGAGCPLEDVGKVGSRVCIACHDGQSASAITGFEDSKHLDTGCEGCHGLGYDHVRIGGRHGRLIDNPADGPANEIQAFCAECHAGQTQSFVESPHAVAQARIRCRQTPARASAAAMTARTPVSLLSMSISPEPTPFCSRSTMLVAAATREIET